MENKEKSILIRVTEEDLAIIRAKANLSGLKVSEYLRRLGKEEKISARLNPEDRRNLIGLGKNLNQLTAYAHKGNFQTNQIQSIMHRIQQILMK